MEESFFGKVKSHWEKGWKSNPNYEKAKEYIEVIVSKEEAKESNKIKETEEELVL